MKRQFLSGLAGFFSAALLILAASVPVTEAKCAIPGVQTALTDAASVFSGRVVSETLEGDMRTFVFDVERVWKGARTKRIIVGVYETTRYQAWFEVGGSYLIYARKAETRLIVGRCSRSRSLPDARDDIKKLGAGKRPAR